MNPLDDQLNRLFRAAAQARPERTPVSPYGLETRVLATWRSKEPEIFWDTALLIRGLVLAALITAISLWPDVNQSASPVSDYLQLADATVPINTTP